MGFGGQLEKGLQIDGGTDNTPIGNVDDSLKTIAAHGPIAPLLAGTLFGAATVANATSSGANNPLLLLRNPLNSGNIYYIQRVTGGTSVANVAMVFRGYADPVFNNTVANISTISQIGLSTTVTVTTSTNHNATVGATATIAGTVNFNGNWTVVSVLSATQYTFTKSAVLITTTENTGTSTVPSSLGTTVSAFSMKRASSMATATGLVTSLPTVSSSGSLLQSIVTGQNSNSDRIIEGTSVSLDPGTSLLITGDPSSNNRNCEISIVWSEVSQ